MRLSNKIILATSNVHKFEEFCSIFTVYPEIQLVMAKDILRNVDKLQFVEHHNTYLENAIAKARVAHQTAHYPTLADDSGIEVACLGGAPGVRSHRYAPPRADLSQDQANCELLLKEMKLGQDRSARFVCSLALVIEGILLHSTATLEGKIAEAPSGSKGFGYDCLFIPDGCQQSLAEMTLDQKNAISHRSKAVHSLIKQLKDHGVTLAKP